MESADRTVNFFLGSSEKKKLENESTNNKSEFYIIIQNDKLQSEVVSLREKFLKLKNEYDEMETDNDKSDERIRYLRNLNKTLVSLRTEDSDVNEEYKFLHKSTDVMNKNFSILVTNMYYIMFMTVMTFTVSLFASIFGLVFGITMFFTLGTTFYSVTKIFLKFDKHTYKKLQKEYLDYKTNLTQKLKSLSKMETEIKKAEDGLPNIMDFIDNV